MVRTKDELMEELKTRLGEDSSDETLSFIEDVSDTYDDMSEQVSKSGEWKNKFEQNDKEWRQKYHDRFFATGDTNDIDDPGPLQDTKDTKKPMSFEDLFTIERK